MDLASTGNWHSHSMQQAPPSPTLCQSSGCPFWSVIMNHPIIFGFPWLHLHDPQISWLDKGITKWSKHRLYSCLYPSHITVAFMSVESPNMPITTPISEVQHLRSPSTRVQASSHLSCLSWVFGGKEKGGLSPLTMMTEG